MTRPFQFKAGRAPLLISIPHAGTEIPEDISASMNPVALNKADTDWHLPLLYNMAEELGASIIQATYSRYVIDLNRPEEDSNLYPGLDTTGLCPIDTFDKQPLYRTDQLPDPSEVSRRIQHYWVPYHTQLRNELQRIRQEHGVAVLWDAHSIASQVPRFFSGKLPDLNFGTADQQSCALELESTLQKVVSHPEYSERFSHIFNGRFKGGHITRHYGQPRENTHAVQLEMTQRLYMNETAPYAYRPDLAASVQPLLSALLEACLAWATDQTQAGEVAS